MPEPPIRVQILFADQSPAEADPGTSETYWTQERLAARLESAGLDVRGRVAVLAPVWIVRGTEEIFGGVLIAVRDDPPQ